MSRRSRRVTTLIASGLLGAALLGVPGSPAMASGVSEISLGTSSNVPDSVPVGITNGPAGGVWVAENAGGIANYNALGILSQYSVGTNSKNLLGIPEAMTTDSSGNVWLGDLSTSVPRIGKINVLNGNVSFFNVPASMNGIADIAAGPDGNIWFTSRGSAQIGKMNPSTGAVTAYTPFFTFVTTSITPGPDGAMWFTDDQSGSVGRIDTSGNVTEYDPPSSTLGSPNAPALGDIVTGPDKSVWFTEPRAGMIGKIVPSSGAITEYPVHVSGSNPQGIAKGSDGNLWFTEAAAGNVGKITTGGAVTEYPLPNRLSVPNRIINGPSGDLWFTESGTGAIAHFDPSAPPSGTPHTPAAANRAAAPFQAVCPSASGGAVCVSQVNLDGSSSSIGSNKVPLPANSIRLTGYLDTLGTDEVLHPPTSGAELVSQSVNVPVSILPYTGITLTESLAGQVTVTASGQTLIAKVPLTLHLHDALFSSGCQISPVNTTQALVPLTGEFTSDYALNWTAVQAEAKDTTVAVPAATNCGLLNGAINSIMGLPSASGKNVFDLKMVVGEANGLG